MDPLIKTKNLNKSFYRPGGDLYVLKDISLDLYRGEMTAVMGPSGAGKSTLLHILGTLDRPTSGDVLYEGRDIFAFNNELLSDFRNRKIGFIFQFHHLMPEFNAIENIIMPALIAGESRQEAVKRAEEILEDMGLSDRMLHKPGELSGGEQQRIAAARSLILGPEIVLADEPTGNLDTGTGEELFRLLKDLNNKGMTLLIVTHNENLSSFCGKVIRMKDGRIVS
jgi:lipoprotein-releasing system ATP-binding protein